MELIPGYNSTYLVKETFSLCVQIEHLSFQLFAKAPALGS